MSDDQKWPEFEKAINNVYAEMPKEAASMKDRKIKPFGWLEKLIWGDGTAAVTWPLTGTIAYNKAAAQAEGLRPEDLMVHELTHIRQIDRKPGLFETLFGRAAERQKNYQERDAEKEAFAQERKYPNRVRTEDVRLR